jgi:hypothetical protein
MKKKVKKSMNLNRGIASLFHQKSKKKGCGGTLLLSFIPISDEA